MDQIVDSTGNTIVLARDDGSYVLTTGSKSITLPIGTFGASPRKLTAEYKNSVYYIAYYTFPCVTIGAYQVLSDQLQKQYGTPIAQADAKYWDAIYCPYRSAYRDSTLSWAYDNATTWGRNEWAESEINSSLDWLFKPTSTSGSASSNTGTSTTSTLTTTAAVDTLTGTAKKADTFDFSSSPNYNSSADRITNFSAKDKDKVQISSSIFGLSGTGTFKIAKNSKDLTKLLATDTQFIYNKGDGGLYFNQNGATPGFGSGGIFAILDGKPTLGTSSVSVVS